MFPLRGVEVSQHFLFKVEPIPPLSLHACLSSRNGGRLCRALVFIGGKSGHVGPGERWRAKSGETREVGVCRGMPAGLRNTGWQVWSLL